MLVSWALSVCFTLDRLRWPVPPPTQKMDSRPYMTRAVSSNYFWGVSWDWLPVPLLHEWPLNVLHTGGTAWPGIISGLEVFTGIVACCSITYRPLVEKVIGLSVAEQEELRCQHAYGWSRINVQRDVTVQNSHDTFTGGEYRTGSQPWELRIKGAHGRWQWASLYHLI